MGDKKSKTATNGSHGALSTPEGGEKSSREELLRNLPESLVASINRHLPVCDADTAVTAEFPRGVWEELVPLDLLAYIGSEQICRFYLANSQVAV